MCIAGARTAEQNAHAAADRAAETTASVSGASNAGAARSAAGAAAERLPIKSKSADE